jgi:protein SCO1/2
MKNYSLLLIAIILFNCKSKTEEKSSRVDALPYYSDASFTPHWLTKDSDDLKGFHKIPEFSLIDQDGQIITDKTFDNKIYVTDFFFTTCPGICPKMTTNMAVLQETFFEDDEVLLLSHSVTPVTDSVPILKNYAETKGVNSNKWHLVTGDRQQIYNLGRKAYFVEEDLGEEKTEDDFLHTENFVLVDKNKHIRGIYNGLNKTSIQQLIADIETLKKEG